MTLVELRFPAGRFHGTPWGRHVNEGAVEWPPSPWRLLRALIATWYLKARQEVAEETLKTLITKLSGVSPAFALPEASLGHTRHYMPYIEGSNEKTTKIFDAFIQVGKEKGILVGWDVELTEIEREGLDLLLKRLGYFGRAESLVEGRLVAVGTVFEPNAVPLEQRPGGSQGDEIVRLLAPLSPTFYEQWRQRLLAEAEGDAPAPKRGGRKNKGAPALDLPADIYEALHADTADLQAAGWSLPPGAAQVNYVRKAQAFAVAPLPPPPGELPRPTVARFFVASQVLPRITQALSVAERVHQSLCKISEKESVFNGQDETGEPLKGHGHAHIWCEALGARDAITHVVVYARDGFSREACLALRKLQKVWGYGGHDLQLILLGLGSDETFADSPAFGESTVWESATPFVPTRHAKTFRDGRPKLDAEGWAIGSPQHEVRRLLPADKLALLTKIDPPRHMIDVNGRPLRSLQFMTERKLGGGRRGHDSGHSLRLTFSQPVRGPINLGYAAHFGLGLFFAKPA